MASSERQLQASAGLDICTKKAKRGKEVVAFKTNPRSRSKCLYQRRQTLFNKGKKVHLMTGADVLIIVKNKSEERFWGTGELKERYTSGNLKPDGQSKESLTNVGKELGVTPLEATPTPSKCGTSGNILRIVGNGKSKRTLSMNDSVQAVLMNKPNPLLLPAETSKI